MCVYFLCINQSVCLCLSVYKSFLPICLSDIHPSSVYIFVYFCIQFICLSFCHIVINPLSPSVHWSVNQSIHSIFSVCLPLFSMSVSNNSNYSPQFQIIEQAQGTCFVDVLGCTSAPMPQFEIFNSFENYYFWQIFYVFFMLFSPI